MVTCYLPRESRTVQVVAVPHISLPIRACRGVSGTGSTLQTVCAGMPQRSPARLSPSVWHVWRTAWKETPETRAPVQRNIVCVKEHHEQRSFILPSRMGWKNGQADLRWKGAWNEIISLCSADKCVFLSNKYRSHVFTFPPGPLCLIRAYVSCNNAQTHFTVQSTLSCISKYACDEGFKFYSRGQNNEKVYFFIQKNRFNQNINTEYIIHITTGWLSSGGWAGDFTKSTQP